MTTRGGDATVSCQGSTITLTSASPANGYQLYVSSSGPSRVGVVFASDQSEWQIVAACVDGRPETQTSGGSYAHQGPGPYDGVPERSSAS